jgi:ubiquinone/menaquinone biosynthesis C-methylase UbiE
MAYGWLAQRFARTEDKSVHVFGMPLRQDLPTRFEEFLFVRDAVSSLDGASKKVLDAGCGFEPGVHILPEVLAGLGCEVVALDLKKPMPGYEKRGNIKRVKGDFASLKYEDNTFDFVTCVSVIEHLNTETMAAAIKEFYRVLKPLGALILTMDRFSPSMIIKLGEPLGFSFGKEIPFTGTMLHPAVSWLVAQKGSPTPE